MDSIKYTGVEVARILPKKQTGAEHVLWERLKKKQLQGFKFRRQHPFKGYIVDFYCSRLNLVIEIDGSSHDNNQVKDDYRQGEIRAKSGAAFLRFTNEEVLYPTDNVIEQISRFISDQQNKSIPRSRPPSPPSPINLGEGAGREGP